MISTAENVTTYIDEQPKQWQPTLRKLRAACRSQLRGYSEGMAYGMPSYEHGGEVEVSFGQQARYLSLYILKQARARCPLRRARRSEPGEGLRPVPAAGRCQLGRDFGPAGGEPRQPDRDLLTLSPPRPRWP